MKIKGTQTIVEHIIRIFAEVPKYQKRECWKVWAQVLEKCNSGLCKFWKFQIVFKFYFTVQNIGILDSWNLGLWELESWTLGTGILESWNLGILESWNLETLKR